MLLACSNCKAAAAGLVVVLGGVLRAATAVSSSTSVIVAGVAAVVGAAVSVLLLSRKLASPPPSKPFTQLVAATNTSNAYLTSDEENSYGRFWANHTQRVLNEAVAGVDNQVTMLGK